MSNSEIEQSGTVKGHLPNEVNLSGRISNGLSLSGHISIGSGAGDFIIKMTVESNDGYYTVASCDATVEQIDAAVFAEKRVVLIATDTTNGGFWEMPLVQAFQGETYIFMAYTFSGYVMSTVYKYGENETWEFVESGISAESVDYYNSAQPDVETVLAALNKLFTNSHTHSNKAVLDKFAETDGKPTYNGEALGSGTGDFIIKMTVESNGDNYTVTSCDKTMEQIDAAVASGQNIKAIAFDKFIMPMTQIMEYGESYTFGAFLGPLLVMANVYKNPESGTDDWEFYSLSLAADIVDYSNAALPNTSTVADALDALVPNSHTHANKDTLDKLSVSNGKLQYNGSDVGLKGADGKDGITPTIGANGNWYLGTTDTGKPSRGEKGDKGDPGSDANVTKANVITALGYTPEAVSAQVTTGSNITLADNTEYRLADVTSLTLTYPTGDFECWMRLTFAASGNATVTLPTGTKYIGTTPDFKNGETWEMSIKDGVVIAQKVGEGA